MYSVKPGRGPSAFGVIGSIIAAVIGVFWTIFASNAGAPGFFVLFGVLFGVMAIAGGIYNLYNATASNRVSQYDVVRTSAEPDPFTPPAARYPIAGQQLAPGAGSVEAYCPFCGKALSPEFQFCPKCGKAVGRAT